MVHWLVKLPKQVRQFVGHVVFGQFVCGLYGRLVLMQVRMHWPFWFM